MRRRRTRCPSCQRNISCGLKGNRTEPRGTCVSPLQGIGSQLRESCAVNPRGKALGVVMAEPPSSMDSRRS